MIDQVILYEVRCDKCGRKLEEVFFGTSVFPTILSAKNTAKSSGWIVDDDKIVCDKCSGKKEKEIIVNYSNKCPF